MGDFFYLYIIPIISEDMLKEYVLDLLSGLDLNEADVIINEDNTFSIKGKYRVLKAFRNMGIDLKYVVTVSIKNKLRTYFNYGEFDVDIDIETIDFDSSGEEIILQ
jgi:hypothetical protein